MDLGILGTHTGATRVLPMLFADAVAHSLGGKRLWVLLADGGGVGD